MEYPKFNYKSVNGQVVERRINGDVVVSCLDGFLVLSKIKYNGKIYTNPTTLIKTIHSRLGMNVEEEIEQIKKHLKI